MELKKSNNIFNVKKTDKDFLEQVNEYKKQAIDIQEHNDTVIETINGQQRTLGNVPKRRPTKLKLSLKSTLLILKNVMTRLQMFLLVNGHKVTVV